MVALMRCVLPTLTVAEVTGRMISGCLIVSVRLCIIPLSVTAVIVTLPASLGVTLPVSLTVAISLSLENH